MQKLYKYLANNSVKSFQYNSRSSLIRMMATHSWYVGLHFWELIYVQSTNVLILPSPIYRWRNWGLERFMIFFKVTWLVSQNLNSSQSNFRDDPLSTTLMPPQYWHTLTIPIHNRSVINVNLYVILCILDSLSSKSQGSVLYKFYFKESYFQFDYQHLQELDFSLSCYIWKIIVDSIIFRSGE